MPGTGQSLAKKKKKFDNWGGFNVTNNTVSRHAALYASTARFVAFLGTFSRDAQQVWLRSSSRRTGPYSRPYAKHSPTHASRNSFNFTSHRK